MNKFFFRDKPKTGWMFEPIDGCSIGCNYCNAFTDGVKIGVVNPSWQRWIHPIYREVNGNKDIIMQEYSEIRDECKKAFVFSTSDPFQSVTSSRLYFEAINLLNDLGVSTVCLSKGTLPSKIMKIKANNEIGITITGIGSFYNTQHNLTILREAKENGNFVWVSMQPFSIETKLVDLARILNGIDFVDKITFGPLDDEQNYVPYYLLSDQISEFCITNGILFLNGTEGFHNANKERLRQEGYSAQVINGGKA